MKEDSPLALSSDLDDGEGWLPESPSSAPVETEPAPATCEAILARVGPVKRGVYVLARRCVDDFEKAAPWEPLYYPPEDPAALIGMVSTLVATIKGVPKKVEALRRALPAGEIGNDEP